MPSPLYEFVNEDHRRGLFPLDLVPIVIQQAEPAIRDFLKAQIFSQEEIRPKFLTSQTADALKNKLHTRRTLVLDPIATLYLYDFVFRTGRHFSQKGSRSNRQRFGYSISRGATTSSADDYRAFRQAKYTYKQEFRFFAHVDIANCFNSIYHHDLTAFVAEICPDEEQHFGQFLREQNGSRSVYCLPQGLYPTKLLANSFLRFIEESRELKSGAIIRFLDDVFLFHNSQSVLEHDIHVLQRILGNKSLALNSQKTAFGSTKTDFAEHKIDKIKIGLLQKREGANASLYDESEVEVHLDDHEVDYLVELIENPNAAEEDVELALSLLTEDKSYADLLAELVITKYPHLVKNLYRFLADAAYDGRTLFSMIKERVSKRAVHEFELFWYMRTLIDYYKVNSDVADLLLQIFGHTNATPVVKAALLEDTVDDYGFREIKEDALRNPTNGLSGIAAAVGLRSINKARRNQLYKYAANSGPHMAVILTAMGKQ